MGNFGGSKVFSALKYTIIWLGAIITATPIVYIFLCGFKTSYEINQPLSIPASIQFANYIKVFENKVVMMSFVNSLIITVGAVLLCILVCSLAAYPLGRSKSKFFSTVYFLFLSAMMIPAVANLISIYDLVNTLQVRDTRVGVILVEAALQIPMGILLYTGFIKTVPKELDEAAAIDGCGYFRRFFTIIFPLLKPVTFSYAAIASIYVWNDFLMPMLIVSDQYKRPITLAIYSFVNENRSDYGAIYAALIVAMIPPILLFVFSQRYLYSGITAGTGK